MRTGVHATSSHDLPVLLRSFPRAALAILSALLGASLLLSTGVTTASAARRPAAKIHVVHRPARTTSATVVRVTWKAHRGWSFRCALDGSKARHCRKAFRKGRLAVGRHKLTITVHRHRIALTIRWRVKASRTTGSPTQTPTSSVTPIPWTGDPGAGGSRGSGAGGTTSIVRFHRYAQGWNASLPDPAGAASHYRIVVLEPSSTTQREQLHATGATTKVLFYTDPLSTTYATRRVAPDQLNTSVDYFEAAQDHPEWFLRGPDGQLITRHYTPTETDYLMDVGSQSYQQQVVANILAQARAGGWDGVFLDDVLPTLRWWVPSGQPSDVVRYPTDAAFQAAYRSFLQNVGTQVRSAGLMVIANVCCNQEYRERSDWAQFLDGTMDEGFVNPTNSATDPLAFESSTAWNEWRTFLAEVVDAERNGKLLLADTRGPANDAPRARYGLATVLLAANGETSYEYHSSDVQDNWFPGNDEALRLGPPTGDFVHLASGAYERSFTNGVVLVNPRAPGSAAATVSLGGSYSGSGLAHVTSVVMPAVSGLILLRDN